MLGKNRTRQNVKGGGEFYLREISPSQTDTFVCVGYLGGTDLADEHSMIELVDEAGNLTDAASGSRKATITTTLKQSGIDEINLVKNAAGKYYDAYYKVKLANGSYQELSAGVCKLKPGPTLKFASATERTIALTVYMLAPKASAARVPTNYNIVENEPYVLVESASPVGLPTEATTVNAALIAAIL